MRIRAAILMGGHSSEHEISLKTGGMVLKNLDRRKFDALPVKIGKDGSWPITLEELKEKCDVAFIAMHGEYGEDGQIQSLLETFGIPYTGSGPIASALAMDKQKTAVLLANNGLLVPESLTAIPNDIHLEFAVAENFKNFPIVIKPANLGSSVGISIVKEKARFQPALQKAFQYSESVLIQRYIKGREITCGTLEINGASIPLMPTEIIPRTSDFFDYYAKYNANGSAEITPPNLPEEIIKNIRFTALKAHKILGCSGMSRTDMIMSKNGKLHILELNTIPGMTETSLLPQQAKKMGIEFPQLLEIIIQSAFIKNKT
ncbi:MAG: hypothetical protein A3I89_00090 [Candidatus Harrisonbacteria bacterium RIFCSPLOWO2_02_FULL_41_11]|uniref:D-alanine--D-alanine ligase n=1 Tax=Candidatus Harrisonbacteria bacterium RIFCSPHIGHO2_02_FULL_42_16 TaxID=1798404 RepID=A0A1G1ZHG4_9BACT|nr:MAG: hypothetical protein A3B92_04145 [Candidatus Harrisonbacteria bacterium RIFCSPHIGHO2_02_FULL_42_16]OGY66905.1 MAG: hypothetical protein A3I89_00090 [Candidatus Harrisonbacteria bacterium RIFCSPLOWO2_02_FULL_41_11]